MRHQVLWQFRNRQFDLSRRGVIMGVVNVTPDSFSDGGRFAAEADATAHARRLIAEGAQIIDIGGESTRPGAEPVSEAEELRRVLPVIQQLRASQGGPAVISIDTTKPGVALAAVAAGADLINDIRGLRDAEMREVVRQTGAGAIAMHMQGSPQDMQIDPHYEDVVGEILNFFRQSFTACLACGIHPMQLAFDPGIGFGKTVRHNLALLRHLEVLRVEQRPLVIGVSRKSFLGKVSGTDSASNRLWPTVALTSYGRARGAQVFRVHDVRPNFEALRMTEAILHEAAAA